MKRISKLSMSLILPVCLIQLGCAHLRRSSESGYANSDWNQDVGRAQKANQSPLERAEQDLQGRYEREQYYKNKPYMRTDREKIEFLQQPNFDARAKYLESKGIDGASTAHPPEIQALVETNDITLGMTKQAVRDSWGEPELVEVAGNPVYGNERWRYDEQVSSTEGFRTEKRMVFFESGRVVGWQTN
jgi:hypothetical protein